MSHFFVTVNLFPRRLRLFDNSNSRTNADFPGVVRVVPNRILSLHTTRSWDFLQVKPYLLDGILSKSQFGFGTVIGILDTGKWSVKVLLMLLGRGMWYIYGHLLVDAGIWPESASFKDEGMGEVPSSWKGICQEGQEFNQSNCNRLTCYLLPSFFPLIFHNS